MKGIDCISPSRWQCTSSHASKPAQHRRHQKLCHRSRTLSLAAIKLAAAMSLPPHSRRYLHTAAASPTAPMPAQPSQKAPAPAATCDRHQPRHTPQPQRQSNLAATDASPRTPAPQTSSDHHHITATHASPHHQGFFSYVSRSCTPPSACAAPVRHSMRIEPPASPRRACATSCTPRSWKPCLTACAR